MSLGGTITHACNSMGLQKKNRALYKAPWVLIVVPRDLADAQDELTKGYHWQAKILCYWKCHKPASVGWHSFTIILFLKHIRHMLFRILSVVLQFWTCGVAICEQHNWFWVNAMWSRLRFPFPLHIHKPYTIHKLIQLHCDIMVFTV